MKFSSASAPITESTSRRALPPRHYLKPQSHHSFYRVWLFFGAFLLAYATLFSLWQVERMPFDVHILGILVAGVCFFPLVKWIAGQGHGLPMFELVCVAYWMAFGLPLYTQPNSLNIYSKVRTFSWEETFATLIMVLLGIVGFIVGYYLLARGRGLTKIRKLDLPLNPHLFVLYAKIAVGVGTILILMRAMNIDLPGGGLAAFSRLLFSQIYIAIILMAYRVYEGGATPLEKRLLWFAVAIAFAFGLAQGMLEYVLIPLLMVFIVRWHVTRRLPVVWLLAGMVLFFLLNSVKQEYRAQTWWSGESLSFDKRVGLWLDLSQKSAEESLSGQPSDEATPAWQKSLRRFDLLHQFIHVYNMTPQNVAYFDGSTYSYLLYGWIPRVLWPDKPVASDSTTQLALSYNLLMPQQVGAVAMGIGLLPEAYANFGAWGVAPILALQGMILSLLGILLNGSRSEGGRAIYLSIMIFFLNGIGTQTSMLFSAIIPGVIGSAIILRPFSLAWSTTPKKSKNLRYLVRSRRKFEAAG